jgi:flavin-binding protein dodecin
VAVINTIDLTGVSAEGWGDAAREALREAGRTIRGINKLEVIDTEAVIEDGTITEYHTRVRIYFEVERQG